MAYPVNWAIVMPCFKSYTNSQILLIITEKLNYDLS